VYTKLSKMSQTAITVPSVLTFLKDQKTKRYLSVMLLEQTMHI